jgi:hypothetical protein
MGQRDRQRASVRNMIKLAVAVHRAFTWRGRLALLAVTLAWVCEVVGAMGR